LQQGLQDWQVIAKRLAAGSAGGNDNVLPAFDQAISFSLVAIQRIDALSS
jgi:hypothetical protein